LLWLSSLTTSERVYCDKGQALSQANQRGLFGKDVTLQTQGKGKYKRTLADVALPDGVNLNQELVKQGWCWWYRKYGPGDTVLEGLEKDARAAKKGLWVDSSPIPPLVYRKARQESRFLLNPP